jgi:DNA-binding PadR family transcriptional regulator
MIYPVPDYPGMESVREVQAMGADPASYLPLTEPTFCILISLATGKKHGYAVRQDVEAVGGGRITLSTSTLYSALGGLLDQALIERVPGDPGGVPRPGLPRKAYVLRDLVGRRVLRAETERLQGLATMPVCAWGRSGREAHSGLDVKVGWLATQPSNHSTCPCR